MAPRVRVIQNNNSEDIPFLRPTLRTNDLRNMQPVSVQQRLKMSAGEFDWRNYFKDQELESAYQHVEIEKEDDPDDTLSNGSSSNPSQDNFDLQEMYEQIYQLP